MNDIPPNQYHHGPTSQPSDPSWDSSEVARIIHSKSDSGKPPACLYLGREETGLLRSHLAEAFGEAFLRRTGEAYYMGLKVVPVDSEHCIAAGGVKGSATGTA